MLTTVDLNTFAADLRAGKDTAAARNERFVALRHGLTGAADLRDSWHGPRSARTTAAADEAGTRLDRAVIALAGVGELLESWAARADAVSDEIARAQRHVDAVRAEYPTMFDGDLVTFAERRAEWHAQLAVAEGAVQQIEHEWLGICQLVSAALDSHTDVLDAAAVSEIDAAALDLSVSDLRVAEFLALAEFGVPAGMYPDALARAWAQLSPEEQLRIIQGDPDAYAAMVLSVTTQAGLPPSSEWALAAFAGYLQDLGLNFADASTLAEMAESDPRLQQILDVLESHDIVWNNLVAFGGDPFAASASGAVALLTSNFVTRHLADPLVFAEFDAADGAVDGTIDLSAIPDVLFGAAGTMGFLLNVMASPSGGGIPITARLATGDHSADGMPNAELVENDGTVSQLDVWAAATNLQAFSGDPEGARAMVETLPNAAFLPYGEESPLPIESFSDDGVATLASTALAAAPTLTDQAVVVAFLPESTGGVRNAIITTYYSVIADESRAWLNPDATDPDDLSAPGHTGVTWFDMAAWASDAVASGINGDAAAFGIHAEMGMRQALADGNQAIFTEMAIRQAMLMDAFPPGVAVTPEAVEAFFNEAQFPIQIDGRPVRLFEDGDAQVRDGLLRWLAARDAVDPLTRQQLTFEGNVSVLMHDQAIADPYAERAVQPAGSDPIDILGDPFHELGASWMIDPQVGDYHYDLTSNIPVATDEQRDHNLVVGSDLTTDLNPAAAPATELFADASLAPITGWEEVAQQNADGEAIGTTFPVDPLEWWQEYGGGGPTNGLPLPTGNQVPSSAEVVYDDTISGTDVGHFTDYADRMWNYVNMFQQVHTNQSVIDDSPAPAAGDDEFGVVLPPSAEAVLG